MRFSVIATSTLASLALALAVPQTEDDRLVKRFNVPSASLEQGFNVPEGTPNGLYSVYIDDNGIAHHTRIDLPENLKLPDEQRLNDKATAPTPERRQGWTVTCQGVSLNREATDITVYILKWRCEGDGYRVPPRQHLYVIHNRVGTCFCNNNGFLHSLCTEQFIVQELQERVSRTCGAYMSGWSTYPAAVSIGSEFMGANNYFCGRDH